MEPTSGALDPEEVTSREKFVAFLGDLERAATTDPGTSWPSTNVDLPAFLEAMAAWVTDAPDGWVPNGVPWSFVARLLTAGHTYE